MGWLVVTCLAFVVPVSALLVWTDPGSPRSLSGRLTAAWRIDDIRQRPVLMFSAEGGWPFGQVTDQDDSILEKERQLGADQNPVRKV